ncbi:CAP domain-containing protein [Candidatus Frankia nodulisporulans]|uniref:CAP domain-containing protein n=1 Tax=Candidatus Frankia nodulisporulans TaxID=2060052 RepID=UPI001581776D|nr:CAP domain-containing protein [Candidatus Frankia nodulisporulans]
MTELVPGANAPLPPGPVLVRLRGPFDLCALVVSVNGKVSGDDDFVFYNQPRTPGVTLADTEITIDPAALRPGAERVVLAASPKDDTSSFGQLPPPVVTLHNLRGTLLVHFTPPPLSRETVLTLVEIYRRGQDWKVRAVGQGYADGLAGLARDFGVVVDDDGRAAAPPPAAPSPPAIRPLSPPQAPSQAPPGPGPAPTSSVRIPPGMGSPGEAHQPVGFRSGAAPAWHGGAASFGDGLPPMLAQVVTLTNLERGRAGLSALSIDPVLTAAADGHSTDMARRGFFAHTSPDGRTVSDRVTALGYRYSRVAENIAAGQTSAEEVVAGWMDSPGHRANILLPQLREIGVGYAVGGEHGTYWTQVFGTKL